MNRDRRIVRLNEAFQYVDDEFLDLVEKEQKISHLKHMKKIKTFLSTAVACVCLIIVLPAAALAYNWFGLREMLLPERKKEPISPILSEYLESPEILALTEWKEFMAEYDKDGTNRTEAEEEDFPDENRKDWLLYGVCSRDMGEQLDRIADKYGLKLHTERETYSLETLENMVGGKLIGTDCTGDGMMYEDYSFWLEGNMELPEYGSFDFQLGYIIRGTLDDRMPVIGNSADYMQWEYTSADGEPVQIMWDGSYAVILAYSDKCFITVTVPGENLPEDLLRTLADQINFKLLKKGLHIGQNWIDSSALDGDRISMSGYWSSPESQALAEWREFLDGYDIDAAGGYGSTAFRDEGRNDWSLYEVYHYEMGEKLDEIADKYGLKLHSEIYFLEPDEIEDWVGGSVMEDCIMYASYIYDDGAFLLSGDVELGEGKEISFQMERAIKGSFSGEYLNIGDVGSYTEWQYVTTGGETVLLAMNPIKSLILADMDNCFVTVNILAGTNDGMTGEDIQEIADKIDFEVIKKVQVSGKIEDSEAGSSMERDDTS